MIHSAGYIVPMSPAKKKTKNKITHLNTQIGLWYQMFTYRISKFKNSSHHSWWCLITKNKFRVNIRRLIKRTIDTYSFYSKKTTAPFNLLPFLQIVNVFVVPLNVFIYWIVADFSSDAILFSYGQSSDTLSVFRMLFQLDRKCRTLIYYVMVVVVVHLFGLKRARLLADQPASHSRCLNT